MSNEMISVVVPIYNMEKYLEKCVDSILNQSYKNLEILLVDDGSTDNSSVICDNYLKLDSRIKVFHKKNGGLSDAKNFGIKHASGSLISFIDSDDWIEKDMYEVMYKKLIDTSSNIAICGRFLDFEDGRTIKSYYPAEMIMDNEDSVIKLNSFYSFDMSSCDKLYDIKLFDGIEFPFGKKCEDAYVTYKLFLKSKRVIYIPNCFYHYFQRQNSISRGNYINMDYIYAAEEQFDFIKEKYKNLYKIAATNLAFSIKNIYADLILKNLNETDELKKYRNKCKKYLPSIIFNKHIKIKKKIIFIVFDIFYPVYRVLIKIKTNMSRR